MSLYGGIEIPGRPDLENIRRLDLMALPMIGRMERVGFAIDVGYLNELSVELAAEMTGLSGDIACYIPAEALDRFAVQANDIEEQNGLVEFNANSAEQVRVLLFDLLAVGRHHRQLQRTGTGELSTAKKQLELCRDDHPVVPLVLRYRQLAKLKTAFADSLPKRAVWHPAGRDCPVCEMPHADGHYRVHGRITTTRTETGRLSMKAPNLQQIPIRSPLGGRIRQAFIAPLGRRLVSVDFSQMELRDLAHLANARSMIEVYEQGLDIHTFTAMRVFGITDENQVDKINHRLPCKNVNFMIVYGASWKGLQAQLALSGVFWDESQARGFITRWFDLYPEVGRYLALQEYRARRYGFVWTPCGRVRRVPEIHSCHPYIRQAGVRQAGNLPIQGANAEQLRLVMGELADEFDQMRSVGMDVNEIVPIHDQIIAEADEDDADYVSGVMERVFSSVMVDKQTGENHWRVPIGADGKVMERWT